MHDIWLATTDNSPHPKILIIMGVKHAHSTIYKKSAILVEKNCFLIFESLFLKLGPKQKINKKIYFLVETFGKF